MGKFIYFNPRNLLLEIVESARGAEPEDFELGVFQPRRFFQNPLSNLRTQYEKRAMITQSVHEGLFAGLAGIDGERTIGYINIKGGKIEERDAEEFYFEELTLRIKEPIPLKRGDQIPNCRVKIYGEAYWGQPQTQRSDRVKLFGPFWRTTDLSPVIPTEWFLSRSNQPASRL